MLSPALVVARKEALDSLRDRRALVSSAVYSLMGPGVIFMVALALGRKLQGEASHAVLIGMMSVFTLVSAFVGGVNVAIDSIAGERERRSLLPLLLHPITRRNVIVGKWLAVSLFSTAGLLLNLLGFAAVFKVAGMLTAPSWPALAWTAVCGLVPLALLAASLELLISTVCRGIKEAHTYLSLLAFLPMGVGMFLVFLPGTEDVWWVPIAGQQMHLTLSMRGAEMDSMQPLLVGIVTLGATAAALLAAANRLERDDVVYGS